MDKVNGYEYDLLTGLYSRWRCHMDLQQILDNGGNRVIGTIDIDNFKKINEEFGTIIGDELLKAVAAALCNSYPGSSVYRVSADVFAFILAPTTYSRYRMSEMTLELFDNLHKVSVEGLKGHHLTYSIGTLYIDPKRFSTIDQIILEVSACRRQAKTHEGTYLLSKHGFIPDIEGTFLILREDRTLYNTINNRLFSIYNEEDWLAYLKEGASLKGDMYQRNQSQLEDLFAYYKAEDLPSFDYYLLYDLVWKYADYLDAFMFGMFIDGILLPYFEKQDLSDTNIRVHLGNLYVMLADSLISLVRMGDSSQHARIVELLNKCRDITRGLPHNSIEFEPYFYALCHLLGHYESVSLILGDVEACDACYDEFRELVLGDDPVVLHDPVSLKKYDYIVNNAKLFPLYRCCYLMMIRHKATTKEKEEYNRRVKFIKEHLVNGVYDMTSPNPEYQDMAVYLQGFLFDDLSTDELLDRLLQGLRTVHHVEYGGMSSDNLMLVTYIYLGASRAILDSTYPQSEKRTITMAGLDMILDLIRRRESIAADHQILFLTQSLMKILIASPVLSPVEKLQYIERTMGVVMLDTYSHSKAVATYAKVILANIIDHYPHLLTGENRPYNSIGDVQANRQELLDFMYCACILHDVGKMNLTPITSNAYRRLTDKEFDLIRKHPEEGVAILRKEPAFDIYRPFVYTHHLWCNRGAGYPNAKDEDFSPKLQFFVYLMSFCDSLEAATSRIGRNYRSAKKFLHIMDEFYVEAGTRYSDEVLQSIISSPDTYYQIRLLVDHKWQDFYQSIFQEVVLNRTTKRHRFSINKMPDIYANKADINHIRNRMELLQRLDILEPLINVFDTVIYTNTEFSEFEMIKSHDKMMAAVEKMTSTHDIIAFTRDYLIDDEYKEGFVEFTNQNTAVQRLIEQRDITFEYHSKISGWVLARLMPAAYDEDGNITHILFFTQEAEIEHKQKAKLVKAATFDGLTGLLNRMGGEQVIRTEIAKGGTQIFAVLDCDNFKQINDNLSHLIGDQVLREQSKILSEVFEKFKVMRLGGDEFVVYINGAEAQHLVNEPDGVKNLFLRLTNKLSTVNLPELRGLAPTMSCGVVYTDNSVDATFEILYKHADESLRESKKQRGGMVTIKELRYVSFFN